MQEQLFFRTRKNSVAVFRVREDEIAHRLEMTQIAIVKADSAEIKPHQKNEPSPQELDQIQTWIKGEKSKTETELDRISDQINLAAQWIQSDADDAEIDAGQHRLLMSLHDLRNTLVRRLGKRKD